jgi:hypothetical protein
LHRAKECESIATVFFEGGEPFLFYPLLIDAVKASREAGFDVGIVTNGYFGVSEDDARLWLEPLSNLGISMLTVSDDALHRGNDTDSPALKAFAAAQKLGISTSTICVDEPSVSPPGAAPGEKGEPVVGGGVMFRGRAVEKLVGGLPTRPWDTFDECPHEDLETPSRLHLDCYGNVLLCQGISIGNMWKTPLPALLTKYEAGNHPIFGCLEEGGPSELVRRYGLEHEDGYVDACHLCYRARTALLDTFTDYLQPLQVYGR